MARKTKKVRLTKAQLERQVRTLRRALLTLVYFDTAFGFWTPACHEGSNMDVEVKSPLKQTEWAA